MTNPVDSNAIIAAGDTEAQLTRKKTASKQVTSGADGKPKTPRSHVPKKNGNGNTDAEGEEIDLFMEKDGKTLKTNQMKRGQKTNVHDVSSKSNIMADGDGQGLEPNTTKAFSAKNRTPKADKTLLGGESGTISPNSFKKRGSFGEAGENDYDTPSKKQRAGALRAKLPTNPAELTEQDRVMIEMKRDGNSWSAITAAYSKITGMQYGKSTLSARYVKIMDTLTEWKYGDVSSTP